MFEDLHGFTRIVVTGPQRSGTRIATKMIANDLGLRYIQEEEFGVHSFERMMLILLEGWVCIHAPALSHKSHLLPSNVAVVFMIRNEEDILASQSRINWRSWPVERGAYEIEDFLPYYEETDPICRIKYKVFAGYQKGLISNCFEVQFEDLAYHHMWINKEDRTEFSFDQTEIESDHDINSSNGPEGSD